MGHTVEHAVPKASRYKVLPPKVRYLRDISLSVTGDNKEKKYIKGLLMNIPRPKYPHHYLPVQLKCGLFHLGTFLTHQGKVRKSGYNMWVS